MPDEEEESKCRVHLTVNDDGRVFMRLTLPKVPPSKNWGCICHPELKFHRPHFTCLTFCRFKRLLKGKIPAEIEVAPYTIFIQRGRSHERIKSFLLKRLLAVAEWLSN